MAHNTLAFSVFSKLFVLHGLVQILVVVGHGFRLLSFNYLEKSMGKSVPIRID